MRPDLQKVQLPVGSSIYASHVLTRVFSDIWHFHPEYEIVLIIKGKGTRYVGDSEEPFCAGDFIALGPNLAHVWVSDASDAAPDASQAVVVQFPASVVSHLAGSLPEFEGIADMLGSTSRGLRFNVPDWETWTPRMLSLCNQNGMERFIAFLRLLDRLKTDAPCTPLLESGYINPFCRSGNQRLDVIFSYISANYAEGVSLAALSERVHLTPASLCRYFKANTGKTLVEYINELRVDYACKLLNDQNLTISEVAYKSGFENLSNFNRRFKQIAGCTPQDFRRRRAIQGVGA